MLSYRHAFHAGNHADVLKHLILVQITRYLCQKDKPFWYVDTHAGAGAYALDSGHAAKLAEYRDGIGRLWGRKDLPPAVADYVALVREMNSGGALKSYPGSPWFALQTMREDDRLRLFELHSTDSRLLQRNFKDTGKRVGIQAADGFEGLKSVLPPPPRRGLVLIDPSYEDKHDYQRVPRALREALERFAIGTYVIWYPQLSRMESRELPEKLKRVAAKDWLHVALTVGAPADDGFGMHGSGLFIVNPPYVLHDTLRTAMPWLVQVLGRDAQAGFTLEQQAS